MADPAGDLEELLARQADVVLEGLRDELAPARELALDQPRGEDDTGGAEDDLIARQGDLDLFSTFGGDDPGELTQRPCRDVRVELL